ncbi:CHASE2 domain-containing protein [Geobacter hydrogenophilus]|uniref:histidine kinase n=1 Tax=Geobacter hydrogenophilus TaxID=40983 RepID=A0A9W6FXY0_9BACT|nr:CHASE2 domain-containing protein [Geobacter hydrogenophilus]MBT0894944.1 CHASE2 domain-containing protein [Geobacter hydrogenophilus]GLI37085.1 hypothetical protein GHYDROH2_05860 [Geobacter hydrogenophilus]
MRTLLVCLSGVFLILLADHLGFFDGANRYFYDFSFRLRGVQRPSDLIVIAAIDEKSLRELGQWPIRRSHYATFLDAARGASAVGFSVIMAEPATDDALLGEAVARHGRVVLPVYIDDRLRVVRPVAPLGHAAVGHIHVEEDVDGVVRRVFGSIATDGEDYSALAVVLHRLAANTPPAAQQWPVPRSPGIVQRNPFQINFSGPEGTFRTVSFSDVVLGRVAPESLQGKIVLAGVTAPGIVERLATPFSHQRRRMPPVELHANLLNSLLKGDTIQIVGEGASVGLCLVLASIWFVAFMKLSEIRAAILWAASIAVIGVGVYSSFAAGSIWIDPVALLLTASFLYIATFISRISEAADRLKEQYAIIAARLDPGDEPPLPAVRFPGFPGYLSAGGINEEIALLDKVVKQLVEQSAQLESVNRELESFSYSVSHDLRAPLRAVEGYSVALREDCADRLDDMCKDYLARISAAINRMESLIEGLLRLSRLSRAELIRKPVNLSAMVREVAEELRKSHPEHQLNILVADDVVVEADPSLLRVVVTNLLENAWKFTLGTARPVIEFGVEESDGIRHYYVRDNGAGFDPDYADKLFVPFQRLHRVEDFPGTGIGLATVQRVVHRHGGRIWAEGTKGRGATFYFTL